MQPAALSSELIKLNVGAGKSRMNGYVNCDASPSSNIDCVFDLQEEWPFKDQSVSEIYASHVIEHIADHMAFFREAWRVLSPLGTVLIRCPYGITRAALADLTHLRPWYPESFAGLQPGYDEGSLGNHYDAHRAYFWVVDAMVILNRPWAWMFRWKILRPLVLFAYHHFFDIGRELWVTLQKATDRTMHPDRSPMGVPCTFAAWKHDLSGGKLGVGEMGVIVRL